MNIPWLRAVGRLLNRGGRHHRERMQNNETGHASRATKISSGIPPPRDGHVHVLVVDENQSVRATCAEMLGRAGLAVSGAGCGEQAWAELQSTHYHLVITDCLIPGFSGTELVRQMRVAGMTQPVILISDLPEMARCVSDPRHDIDAFLPKPFSFYELLNRVNAALDFWPAGDVRGPGLARAR